MLAELGSGAELGWGDPVAGLGWGWLAALALAADALAFASACISDDIASAETIAADALAAGDMLPDELHPAVSASAAIPAITILLFIPVNVCPSPDGKGCDKRHAGKNEGRARPTFPLVSPLPSGQACGATEMSQPYD